jgi:hypothetical protein
MRHSVHTGAALSVNPLPIRWQIASSSYLDALKIRFLPALAV